MLSEQSRQLVSSQDQYQLLKKTFTDYVRQCEEIFGEQEARAAHLQLTNDTLKGQVAKLTDEAEKANKRKAATANQVGATGTTQSVQKEDEPIDLAQLNEKLKKELNIVRKKLDGYETKYKYIDLDQVH